MSSILLRGVRTRNLRGFDVSFPVGSWTNVLGVSGSGKTSLCFHTLHALSQQRFLSALAPAARLLLEDLPRPSLDSASGLIPTLALEQGQDRPPKRMRALDAAGLDLPLRSLMVACGQAVSPLTGLALRSWQPAEIVQWLLEERPLARLQVLLPVGDHGREHWMHRGFTKAMVGEETLDLEESGQRLGPSDWIVVDRLVAEGKFRQRIGEALGLAYASAGGHAAVWIMPPDAPPERLRFSDHPWCPESGKQVPRPALGMFSPHSVQGACPECAGTGGQDGQECATCQGNGLGDVSRWFRLGGLSMAELLALSFRALAMWLDASGLCAHPMEAIAETSKELAGKLACLERLGIGYLQAGRRVDSLSFGEHHRLKLAFLTGAPLSGVCYVLDEPATGLHPTDAVRLQEHLESLVQLGNTLVVVEHRLKDLGGDQVLEIGPAAGERGGELVFSGDLSEFDKSETLGAAWSRRAATPSQAAPADFLRLEGASGRNLRGASLDVALDGITGVCGPSGAGKSTIVMDTLVPALRERLGQASHGFPFDVLSGGQKLAALEVIDPTDEAILQPRSIVATLTGILDPLRSLMASLPAAKSQGYAANRFSPNLKGGRCEPCQGLGRIRVDLPYLPATYAQCPHCTGMRFAPEILDIRWRGLNLGQILELSCQAALDRFQAHPALRALLEPLVLAGLGHVPLGFPSAELSGGEVARIRLCNGLSRKVGPTLFVMEEPSRGLHPADTAVLVELLRALVRKGHSVLAISHDPGLLAACDWVCELGPGAGEAGGSTIASAPPIALARGDTPTAASLRREYGGLA